MNLRKDYQIEKIEDLPISIVARFEILLVFLELKPASIVVMNGEHYREGEKKLKIAKSAIRALKRALNGAGFEFWLSKQTERSVGGGPRQRYCHSLTIYVSKDKKVLKALVYGHRSKPMIDEVVGLNLGYSAQAVKAFVAKEGLVEAGEFNKLKYECLARIAGRRFARSNYRQELDEFAEKLKMVAEASPMIYSKLLKYFFGPNDIRDKTGVDVEQILFMK